MVQTHTNTHSCMKKYFAVCVLGRKGGKNEEGETAVGKNNWSRRVCVRERGLTKCSHTHSHTAEANVYLQPIFRFSSVVFRCVDNDVNTQTNKECRSDKKTDGLTNWWCSEWTKHVVKLLSTAQRRNASRHPQNAGLFVYGILSGRRRLRADTFQNIKYIFSQARHCKTIADSYELRAGDWAKENIARSV